MLVIVLYSIYYVLLYAQSMIGLDGNSRALSKMKRCLDFSINLLLKSSCEALLRHYFFHRLLPTSFSPFKRMANPISPDDELLALTAFALQSSQSLYQAAETFKVELKALDGVFQSLHQIVIWNCQSDSTEAPTIPVRQSLQGV